MKISPALLNRLYPSGYCTSQNLALLLGDTSGIYNKISRLVRDGVLLKVRRGFYLISPEYRQAPVNTMLIANLLYGPSYVSLESALSFYGLIPEAVVSVTSVALQKSKHFQTPIGDFFYSPIPLSAFPRGVVSLEARGHFLMATAEKALLDRLYLSRQTVIELDFVTESFRIEPEMLKRLQWDNIVSLAALYSRNFGKQILNLSHEVKRQLL